MFGCLKWCSKHVLQQFHINWLLKCGSESQTAKSLGQKAANRKRGQNVELKPKKLAKTNKANNNKQAGQTSIELGL